MSKHRDSHRRHHRERCGSHTATTAPVAWTPFQWTGQVVPSLESGAPDGTVWANSRYIVVVRSQPPLTRPTGNQEELVEPVCLIWLSIRNRANTACRDWRDFQRIKNELVGEEAEAAELYPAESRLVDCANQFHLWCFPPGFRFPFGFGERMVLDAGAVPGTRQRPL